MASATEQALGELWAFTSLPPGLGTQGAKPLV